MLAYVINNGSSNNLPCYTPENLRNKARYNHIIITQCCCTQSVSVTLIEIKFYNNLKL